MPATPSDPFVLLEASVSAGDAAETARLLDQFPELKPRLDDALPNGPFGGTAMLRAVQIKNRDVIDALLAAGANINARSHWWAGSFGVLDSDSGIEPFLIERGAIVDAHAAARLGMVDRLKELIAADPSVVHARGGDGQTPLHFARTVEIAELLLEHGAEIDARDIDHESTPAQYLVRVHPDVVRYLIGRGCRTDILMAAALGDLDLVKKHLAADPATIDVSVSERDFPMRNPRAGGTTYNWTLGRGWSAHIVAHRFGHADVFQYLIERSPAALKLTVSCEIGDEAPVKSLLAADPNLKTAPKAAYIAKLNDAARDNNTPAVRLLLLAGWPVDHANADGVTALHWAAFHGNAAVVDELLRHGAPVDVKEVNHDGTPLDWAEYGSRHGWYRETGTYPEVMAALRGAMGV